MLWLWQLVINFDKILRKCIEALLSILVYAAIAVAVAHRAGWLNRWIWFVLEKEAKKIMNGAQVTIGSFTIEWSEILQGKVTLHASNVVIHTPKRDEWQWDSPLIARIGKATVECNAVITVFHVLFLRREVPIEAYTVIVSDAQVFVERRQSVINVYLLNPTLQLPPPPYAKKVGGNNNGEIGEGPPAVDDQQIHSIVKTNGSRQAGRDGPSTSVSSCSDTSVCHELVPEKSIESSSEPAGYKEHTTFFETKSSINPLGETKATNHDNHNQQAKVLVNELLHAVQVLGGAAARGQLPGAIKQQGLELVDRLQGFRKQENLEEGIRVMQQVGKVAVESLQSAPQLLPQPDSTIETEKKIVYIRIGRIIVNDLRIFTKDSWINAGSTQKEFVDSKIGNANGIQNKSNSSSLSSTSTSQITDITNKTSTNHSAADINMNRNRSWNKPIHIETMVLKSSELCPPMSMKDHHKLPAIFQSVDKIMEVVLRRVLAEIAKTNSGRLFSTAMGEVLSVMVSNPQHTVSPPSTSGSASLVNGPSKITTISKISPEIS